MQRFLFPRWVNPFLAILGIAIVGGGVFAAAMGGLITDPETLNIGYQPEQPVPFSHAIHAGQLKMDCRYCHNTVFEAAHAAVPPTATCINCHSPANDQGITALAAVHAESPKLGPIHESWKVGQERGLDASAQLARVRVLQSCRPRERRCQLQNLSRSYRPNGSRLSARTAFDGMVHHLSPQPGSASATERVRHQTGLGTASRLGPSSFRQRSSQRKEHSSTSSLCRLSSIARRTCCSSTTDYSPFAVTTRT